MEMDPRSAVREGEEIRSLETGSDASPTLTPNPNADIALVENLIKTIDPRSVIREGGESIARATGGAADYLLPTLEKLKGGERLSEENRESILFQIQSLDPRSSVREGEELVPKQTMPMMGEEDKNLFMSLMNKGIPEDMIIDIMADAKMPQVGSSGAAGGAINPAEFGGLPKPSSPDGNPSMTNPQTGNPETMNQNDMAMYLQNKVADIRSRTGGSPQGGVNPAIPNNPKMGALPQPPNQRPTMTRDPYGADTTSSPFGNSMNKPMNT